jgi:hypothetical protein
MTFRLREKPRVLTLAFRPNHNPEFVMAIKIKWNVEADLLQACNCDYGCPCEFSAPPTKGFCEGMGAWKINRGSYGDVKLDGLGLGFAAHWPKAIHEGGGTVCIFVDEKANAAQRDALLNIASGQAGGLPFEIIAATFSKILDPVFASFQFHLNGRECSVKIGDVMTASLTPILNPMTKEPESVRVQHATGFIFKEAECLSAREMKVKTPGLQFSWPDKAAFLAQVKYGN